MGQKVGEFVLFNFKLNVAIPAWLSYMSTGAYIHNYDESIAKIA